MFLKYTLLHIFKKGYMYVQVHILYSVVTICSKVYHSFEKYINEKEKKKNEFKLQITEKNILEKFYSNRKLIL